MESFTDIGQFRGVVKTIVNYYEKIHSPEAIPTLTFVGTVKLHGTNGGLRRKNGQIRPQSRNRIIDKSNDNCGFAAFIEQVDTTVLNQLFDAISTDPEDEITLYGEFAGKGVQQGVAATQLDKFWAIFAARLNGKMVADVSHLSAPQFRIFNVADCGRFKVTIDFKKADFAIPELEKRTLDVEKECPFGLLHGVSGIGEGIVWRCVERPSDTELWFKTKGDAHSKTKVRKVATVDIEKVNSINDCVDVVLPMWRLNQGFDYMREQQLDIDPKNMGEYLRWLAADILKEESDTITGNNLNWKDVQKVITNRARQHFLQKYNNG